MSSNSALIEIPLERLKRALALKEQITVLERQLNEVLAENGTAFSTQSRRSDRQNARLSPDELCRLARRLAAEEDREEIARIREQMVRGFYGN